MSNWAEKLIKETRAKREEKLIQTEKVLSDRRLIHANQDEHWIKIRKQIAELIKELNEEMGEECLVVTGAEDHNKLTIKVPDHDNGSDLVLNPKDGLLRVNFHGAELRLIVNSREELIWQSTATSMAWTTDQIAKEAVERAWKDQVK